MKTNALEKPQVCLLEVVKTPQWKALLAAMRPVPADITVEGFCVAYRAILGRLPEIPVEDVASVLYRECRAAMKNRAAAAD